MTFKHTILKQVIQNQEKRKLKTAKTEEKIHKNLE